MKKMYIHAIYQSILISTAHRNESNNLIDETS